MAGVGCPCSREPNLRNVIISASVIAPTAFNIA